MLVRLLVSIAILTTASGCVERSPGPAESFGRSLDVLATSLDNSGDQNRDSRSREAYLQRWERELRERERSLDRREEDLRYREDAAYRRR